jgi:predicted DNA-binding transcriptional regulator YafY
MQRALRVRRAVPRLPSTRPPLRRMVWLVGRLRAGDAITANDVAGQFEISLRTAYRDVDFLRDQLRAPVEYDAHQRTYVLTDKTFSLPPVDLSRGELLGLFFAERVVRQYRGTPYEDDLRAALRKIEQSLPEQVTVDLSSLDGFLSLDLGPLATPDAEVFRGVVDAASRRRRLRMTYTSLTRGKTSERSVDPYRVYNLRGDWYLAAFDPRHRAVRDFALHRIQSAVVLDEGFEVDRSFDFAAYMKDAFSIEKGGRPIRERRWHPTARIQERLDGGCVLRMQVAGLGEVKRWIMQFGAEAEVLSPKSLRREIAEEQRAAARQYGVGATHAAPDAGARSVRRVPR